MVLVCTLLFSLGCSLSDPAPPPSVEVVSQSDPYQEYLTHDGVYVTFSGGIGEPALIRLLEDSDMQPLKSVTVHGQQLTQRSVVAIMNAESTAPLHSLFLQGSTIGDAGLTVIANAPRLAQIEYLNLEKVNATSAGVAALAASPHLRAKSLSIGWQAVGDAGAEALAQAKGLKSLRLEAAEVGVQGAVALIEQSGLEALTLIGNPAGFTDLAAVSPSLQALILDDCGLETSSINALAKADAPALTSLSIERTPLSDEALKAIMAASWFPRLDKLSLSAQRTSPDVRAALIAAYRGEFLSIYRKDL